MVTLPAFAMGTLKFLADFLKTRFPLLSAFHALMSAKSAVMASSIMLVVAIEHTVLLSSAFNLHVMIMVKSDWFSLVHKCPKASGCVKCRDSCTSGTNTLNKRTLEQEWP